MIELTDLVIRKLDLLFVGRFIDFQELVVIGRGLDRSSVPDQPVKPNHPIIIKLEVLAVRYEEPVSLSSRESTESSKGQRGANGDFYLIASWPLPS